MRLNNKGIAISSMMYIILVLGVLLIFLTLTLISSRDLVLNKIKNEALNNIYGSSLNDEIVISNVILDSYNNAESIDIDFNSNEIKLIVNLPSADSNIKYKVRMVNIGTSEMYLYDINNLPNTLEYQLQDYVIKTDICDNNGECGRGTIKDFYITLKYKDGANISNNNQNLNLLFDFRKN